MSLWHNRDEIDSPDVSRASPTNESFTQRLMKVNKLPDSTYNNSFLVSLDSAVASRLTDRNLDSISSWWWNSERLQLWQWVSRTPILPVFGRICFASSKKAHTKSRIPTLRGVKRKWARLQHSRRWKSNDAPLSLVTLWLTERPPLKDLVPALLSEGMRGKMA